MMSQGLTQNSKDFVQLVRHRDITIFKLWRRNLLRLIISEVSNNYASLLREEDPNGFFIAHPKDPIQAKIYSKMKVAIDTSVLLENLERIEQERLLAEHWHLDALEVFYEDLLATSPNHQKTWEAIQRHIGAGSIEELGGRRSRVPSIPDPPPCWGGASPFARVTVFSLLGVAS